MADLASHCIPADKYYEIERELRERFEYLVGDIFSMTGASQLRDRIQGNIDFILRVNVRANILAELTG
jgi:Uma2 family endonuclease